MATMVRQITTFMYQLFVHDMWQKGRRWMVWH